MKKTATLLLVILTVVSLGAQAPVSDVPKLDFEKYTLPNGLEVILSEDHRLPMVAVNLWYHVGPANEAAGRTGFAHLFEHMMFQGSKHVAGRCALPAARGRRRQRRQRHHRLRSHQLLRDDAVEPARARALARIRSHGLSARRGRPGQAVESAGRRPQRAPPERREPAVRDRRRGDVSTQLFPKGHPYYGVVIGSHADIQAAKLDDVKQFFKPVLRAEQREPRDRRRHRQGGDQEARREVLRPAEARTGGAARERRRRRRSPPSGATVVKDRVELPRVYMAWLTPPIFKPGDADADIAGGVLGGGTLEPAVQEARLREADRAGASRAYQQSLMLGSVFSHRGDRAARSHARRSSRRPSTKSSTRSARTDRPAPRVERARNVDRDADRQRPSRRSADSAAWPIG